MHYSKIAKIKCKWLVKQELPDPLKEFPTFSTEKCFLYRDFVVHFPTCAMSRQPPKCTYGSPIEWSQTCDIITCYTFYNGLGTL